MKYTLLLFIVLCSVTGAMAQEYKTDVSIRSQVINGTVPGAQYRDVKSNRPQSAVANKQESTGSRIKNNTEPGKQYKKSAQASSGKGKAAAAPEAKPLASDKKAELVQPAVAPALPQNLTQ